MADLAEITFDYIVVGSGPSGAMCAQTLVEAGRKVLMLDAGITPMQNNPAPNETFEEIRKNKNDQYNIFLGPNFESIKYTATKAGTQLTPSKKYIIDTKNFLPLASDSFFPVESLAYGGLGEAWGLGCNAFSENELRRVGLNVAEMQLAYQTVADRIGISYTTDDTELYTMPGIKNLQPGINIDENACAILSRYNACRNRIQKSNFFLGRPSLALLTQKKDDRSATPYTDMDFYVNHGKSAYRPSITIEQLTKYSNFVYVPGLLVISFRETTEKVEVLTIRIGTTHAITYSAKKLMLATNVLSTARIALRSFNHFNKNIPLISNPYSYVSCLLWKRMGKLNLSKKTSTVQLSLFHDPDKQNSDVAMASIYSYGSLMLFRILKEMPINFKDALQIMHFLMPSIVIAGIHHPDQSSPTKFLSLQKTTNSQTADVLQATYELSELEKGKIEEREKKFNSIFRHLNCFPLKKITPAYGASIHYAGTLPFHNEEELLTTQPSGRLSMTKNVFIADASGFKFLPAKGITFSLMANAHRTATNALKNE